MGVIGCIKPNRFYWLLLLSALCKIATNFLFRIEFQRYRFNINISILGYPVLNDHIFVRFIYYYFGYVILGSIFSKTLRINREYIDNDIFKNIKSKALPPLLLIIIIYIIYEMLIFYLDQKSLDCVNFWVLEIFFIHIFLSKTENLKLYSHQILSFAIIFLLSFAPKLISSFFRQCEYPNQDPNDIDEAYINMTKTMDPSLLPIMGEIINQTIRYSIMKANEEGNRICSNKYNIFLLDDYFGYFIALAAVGYLISSILKSYSLVKLSLIKKKSFISSDKIITLMGIIGLALNIILLIISSLFPCGESDLSSNFCSSVKHDETKNNTYYLDNFLNYIADIRDDLFPKNKDVYRRRTPKIIIAEIICSFIMSILGFAKMRIDLSIIEMLGVFHLLIPEVIYIFAKDIYIIIYKVVNNIIDITQITQSIIIIITQFFTFIGIIIYLEIIELRFCKLNENINKNIALRGNEDIEEISEMEPLSKANTLLDNDN